MRARGWRILVPIFRDGPGGQDRTVDYQSLPDEQRFECGLESRLSPCYETRLRADIAPSAWGLSARYPARSRRSSNSRSPPFAQVRLGFDECASGGNSAYRQGPLTCPRAPFSVAICNGRSTSNAVRRRAPDLARSLDVHQGVGGVVKGRGSGTLGDRQVFGPFFARAGPERRRPTLQNRGLFVSVSARDPGRPGPHGKALRLIAHSGVVLATKRQIVRSNRMKGGLQWRVQRHDNVPDSFAPNRLLQPDISR